MGGWDEIRQIIRFLNCVKLILMYFGHIKYEHKEDRIDGILHHVSIRKWINSFWSAYIEAVKWQSFDGGLHHRDYIRSRGFKTELHHRSRPFLLLIIIAFKFKTLKYLEHIIFLSNALDICVRMLFLLSPSELIYWCFNGWSHKMIRQKRNAKVMLSKTADCHVVTRKAWCWNTGVKFNDALILHGHAPGFCQCSPL